MALGKAFSVFLLCDATNVVGALYRCRYLYARVHIRSSDMQQKNLGCD